VRFSHVLWDWNGTLLDDLRVVFSALSLTLHEFGLSPLSLERYRATVRHPMHTWLAAEGIIGHDQVELYAQLAERFHEHYLAGRFGCSLHGGAAELVDRIHRSGTPHAILSAHPQDLLESGLEAYGLTHYFAGIFGARDRAGQGKHGIARQLIEELRLDCRTTVLIGDMDHDVEVAHRVGLTCYLVGNGLQAPEKLKGLGVPVFSSLDELAIHLLPEKS
jgi:phosphoglycolate phosphatase